MAEILKLFVAFSEYMNFTLPPLFYIRLNQESSFELVKGDLFSEGIFTLIL